MWSWRMTNDVATLANSSTCVAKVAPQRSTTYFRCPYPGPCRYAALLNLSYLHAKQLAKSINAVITTSEMGVFLVLYNNVG